MKQLSLQKQPRLVSFRLPRRVHGARLPETRTTFHGRTERSPAQTRQCVTASQVSENEVHASDRRLYFDVTREVTLGEELKVVGNIPELGEWDVSNALTLEWHPGNVWKGSISVPSTEISYKFVKASQEHSHVEWEERDDRTINLSELNASGVKVTAAWEQEAEYSSTTTLTQPKVIQEASQTAESNGASPESEEPEQSETYTARIAIQKELCLGNVLRLVGSHSSLGAWDFNAAPAFTWGPEHVWQLELELPLDSAVDWKVVQTVEGPGSWCDWQAGENTVIDPVALGIKAGDVLEVGCSWDGDSRARLASAQASAPQVATAGDLGLIEIKEEGVYGLEGLEERYKGEEAIATVANALAAESAGRVGVPVQQEMVREDAAAAAEAEAAAAEARAKEAAAEAAAEAKAAAEERAREAEAKAEAEAAKAAAEAAAEARAKEAAEKAEAEAAALAARQANEAAAAAAVQAMAQAVEEARQAAASATAEAAAAAKAKEVAEAEAAAAREAKAEAEREAAAAREAKAAAEIAEAEALAVVKSHEAEKAAAQAKAEAEQRAAAEAAAAEAKRVAEAAEAKRVAEAAEAKKEAEAAEAKREAAEQAEEVEWPSSSSDEEVEAVASRSIDFGSLELPGDLEEVIAAAKAEDDAALAAAAAAAAAVAKAEEDAKKAAVAAEGAEDVGSREGRGAELDVVARSALWPAELRAAEVVSPAEGSSPAEGVAQARRPYIVEDAGEVKAEEAVVEAEVKEAVEEGVAQAEVQQAVLKEEPVVPVEDEQKEAEAEPAAIEEMAQARVTEGVAHDAGAEDAVPQKDELTERVEAAAAAAAAFVGEEEAAAISARFAEGSSGADETTEAAAEQEVVEKAEEQEEKMEEAVSVAAAEGQAQEKVELKEEDEDVSDEKAAEVEARGSEERQVETDDVPWNLVVEEAVEVVRDDKGKPTGFGKGFEDVVLTPEQFTALAGAGAAGNAAAAPEAAAAAAVDDGTFELQKGRLQVEEDGSTVVVRGGHDYDSDTGTVTVTSPLDKGPDGLLVDGQGELVEGQAAEGSEGSRKDGAQLADVKPEDEVGLAAKVGAYAGMAAAGLGAAAVMGGLAVDFADVAMIAGMYGVATAIGSSSRADMRSKGGAGPVISALVTASDIAKRIKGETEGLTGRMGGGSGKGSGSRIGRYAKSARADVSARSETASEMAEAAREAAKEAAERAAEEGEKERVRGRVTEMRRQLGPQGMQALEDGVNQVMSTDVQRILKALDSSMSDEAKVRHLVKMLLSDEPAACRTAASSSVEVRAAMVLAEEHVAAKLKSRPSAQHAPPVLLAALAMSAVDEMQGVSKGSGKGVTRGAGSTR